MKGYSVAEHLTPKQIVEALDRHIVGQADAKRAVAIAMRNRWRRQQLPESLRDEVAPKNILMIGPTGVGKTEIARRLASLVKAPFIKVEASKYTEVGYHGRDVESMVRDLLDLAINMVRDEQTELVKEQVEQAVEERLLDALLPGPKWSASSAENTTGSTDTNDAAERHKRTREKLREQLRRGDMEDKLIEVSVEEKAAPMAVFSNMGLDQMEPDLQNMFDKLMPSKQQHKKIPIREARKVLFDQEAERFVDREKTVRLAIERSQTSGIIFLDELDKVCGTDSKHGPDVSRQGVQRDLLPIVEGSTVATRHGMVRTDHILFVAAGAFHAAKPSDMMPELQGRFPIRVELADLTADDFERILTEPESSLVRQQKALLATEKVTLDFTPDGIKAMAQAANRVNQTSLNIGARRLYTIIEKVVEQLSFDAPDMAGQSITIDADYVNTQLDELVKDEDLSKFIL